MKKIRIGNDFVFNWAIERGGLPEDLSSVLEKHLHLSVFGKRVELVEGVDYDITGNVIRIEVTPTIANIIGTYKAEFHYILPDTGLIDEDRKCAVDVDAFQIVAKTAQADDSTEFSMTSDMAIAFKGDKGDSAYQVWLEEGNIGTEEDYFAYLRQPAVDAGASISELEGEIQVSEGLRVQAESERDLAEATRVQAENERLASETIRQSNEGNRIDNEATRVQNEAERISKEGIRQSNEVDRVEAESERVQAENERETAETTRISNENNRVTAEQERVEAESLRVTAENSRQSAESLRVEAESLRQTNTQIAITNAEDATENANTAAQNADDAREAIQDDLAQKANQTDLAQLAGEVKELGIKDAVQGAKIKDIENVLSTANLGQSAQLSVSGVLPLLLPKNAANSGMSVKLEGLTEDVGGVITHFEPTGRVRSVDKNGLNPTALYLTAPELRSNGNVKDEIRKGSNGYELVKRVGVGTLGNNLVTNGTFDTATGWTIMGESTISNGLARIYTSDGSQTYIADQSIALSSTKAYKAIFDVLDSNGERLHLSNIGTIITPTPIGDGVSKLFVGNGGYFAFRRTRIVLTDVTIDNVKLHEVIPQDGTISNTSTFTELSDGTILYTLATPEIIPISYGGVLNSAENGTVYHEQVIADAGVYATKMDVLLTDYPIATIVEIIKHENGVDTYLDVATAVVASDGLSFTHPDLASGDLVLFTYAYSKENVSGNITASFYDSNVVKIDTVTGKAYKINEVVTNGVLTRTLTEV